MAWPRIQPDGRCGEFNEEGFAFYHRLLDELEKHGIEPLVTLYHWDLPQPLEDAGRLAGARDRRRFVEYARRTAEEFKDRVTYWTTFNEPWCTAFLGYSSGSPRARPQRARRVARRGAPPEPRARPRLRRRSRRSSPTRQVSIVLNSHVPRPWNPADPRDVDGVAKIDALANRIFMDPFTVGRVPRRPA